MASENKDYITPKQQLFIQNYLANGGNGTQAAIAAGYSQRSAHVLASDLLKQDKIKKRLEVKTSESHERLALDADWVTSRLMVMAEEADSDATKVRSLEVLGKVLGMYAPEKKQIDANVNTGDFLASLDLTEDLTEDDADTIQ